MRNTKAFPTQREGELYLTEGGVETELMYKWGFDLPHFSTFALFDNREAMSAIHGIFHRYLDIAAKYGLSALISGLDYRAGSMGTCIEGEWDECLEVIKRCFDDMKQDCHRISVSIKADYRKGKEHCIERKVEHVEKELGHTLKK